jgi:hypothetical protein
MEDLYSEKYKTVKKEIEGNIGKQRISMCVTYRINIVKLAGLLKATSRFSVVILRKIPVLFFTEIEKILKFL